MSDPDDLWQGIDARRFVDATRRLLTVYPDQDRIRDVIARSPGAYLRPVDNGARFEYALTDRDTNERLVVGMVERDEVRTLTAGERRAVQAARDSLLDALAEMGRLRMPGFPQTVTRRFEELAKGVLQVLNASALDAGESAPGWQGVPLTLHDLLDFEQGLVADGLELQADGLRRLRLLLEHRGRERASLN